MTTWTLRYSYRGGSQLSLGGSEERLRKLAIQYRGDPSYANVHLFRCEEVFD